MKFTTVSSLLEPIEYPAPCSTNVDEIDRPLIASRKLIYLVKFYKNKDYHVIIITFDFFAIWQEAEKGGLDDAKDPVYLTWPQE